MAEASELYDPQLAAAIDVLRGNCEAAVSSGRPRDCVGFAALVLAVENLYRAAIEEAERQGFVVAPMDETVWQDVAQSAAAVIADRLDRESNRRLAARN